MWVVHHETKKDEDDGSESTEDEGPIDLYKQFFGSQEMDALVEMDTSVEMDISVEEDPGVTNTLNTGKGELGFTDLGTRLKDKNPAMRYMRSKISGERKQKSEEDSQLTKVNLSSIKSVGPKEGKSFGQERGSVTKEELPDKSFSENKDWRIPGNSRPVSQKKKLPEIITLQKEEKLLDKHLKSPDINPGLEKGKSLSKPRERFKKKQFSAVSSILKIESTASIDMSEVDSTASIPMSHLESLGGIPMSQMESITGMPLSYLDSITVLPASQMESVAGIPQSQLQSVAGFPVSELESIIDKPLPKLHSIAGNPLSKTKTVSGTPVSKTKSIAVTPVSKAKSIAITPVSKAKSIAVTPVSKAESIAVSPVSKAESISGISVSKAETISDTIVPQVESTAGTPIPKIETTTRSSVSKIESTQVLKTNEQSATVELVSELKEQSVSLEETLERNSKLPAISSGSKEEKSPSKTKRWAKWKRSSDLYPLEKEESTANIDNSEIDSTAGTTVPQVESTADTPIPKVETTTRSSVSKIESTQVLKTSEQSATVELVSELKGQSVSLEETLERNSESPAISSGSKEGKSPSKAIRWAKWKRSSVLSPLEKAESAASIDNSEVDSTASISLLKLGSIGGFPLPQLQSVTGCPLSNLNSITVIPTSKLESFARIPQSVKAELKAFNPVSKVELTDSRPVSKVELTDSRPVTKAESIFNIPVLMRPQPENSPSAIKQASPNSSKSEKTISAEEISVSEQTELCFERFAEDIIALLALQYQVPRVYWSTPKSKHNKYSSPTVLTSVMRGVTLSQILHRHECYEMFNRDMSLDVSRFEVPQKLLVYIHARMIDLIESCEKNKHFDVFASMILSLTIPIELILFLASREFKVCTAIFPMAWKCFFIVEHKEKFERVGGLEALQQKCDKASHVDPHLKTFITEECISYSGGNLYYKYCDFIHRRLYSGASTSASTSIAAAMEPALFFSLQKETDESSSEASVTSKKSKYKKGKRKN